LKIIIEPGSRSFEVPPGQGLRDLLFAAGVEFPCGGVGTCRGCSVQVLSGEAPVTADDAREFSPSELRAGRRLGCRLEPSPDLTVLVREWEGLVLGDAGTVDVVPREGLGIAIDLGTTTLVAQLVDLRSGGILSVRTALNRQRRWGDDIMSRLANALRGDGRAGLCRSIREQLGEMAASLAADHGKGRVREVVVVGNTAMRSFLLDEDPALLAFKPFEPASTDAVEIEASSLGWEALPGARVFFPPLLGGLVGADILAGILAVDLHRETRPAVLADLGTNAEVVVTDGRRIAAASAAAGPAFEGARIGMGMIAQKGAIDSVAVRDGVAVARVIGGGAAEGICGSGLVDAVACGLDLGRLSPSGRMRDGPRWEIAPGVSVTQADVRELQLAKGAVRAGVDLLIGELGLEPADVSGVHLAGGFGNYVSAGSAVRIGLFPFGPERLRPAGNAALRGARKILLLGEAGRASGEDVRRRIRHVPLADLPSFQDAFADAMAFPVEGRN
jgi:uncharacterized 2Fe-2S/4Fe-4S cluster protein (DUF4445 family)